MALDSVIVPLVLRPRPCGTLSAVTGDPCTRVLLPRATCYKFRTSLIWSQKQIIKAQVYDIFSQLTSYLGYILPKQDKANTEKLLNCFFRNHWTLNNYWFKTCNGSKLLKLVTHGFLPLISPKIIGPYFTFFKHRKTVGVGW